GHHGLGRRRRVLPRTRYRRHTAATRGHRKGCAGGRSAPCAPATPGTGRRRRLTLSGHGLLTVCYQVARNPRACPISRDVTYSIPRVWLSLVRGESRSVAIEVVSASMMTSDATAHIARCVGGDLWVVSWLPGRTL